MPDDVNEDLVRQRALSALPGGKGLSNSFGAGDNGRPVVDGVIELAWNSRRQNPTLNRPWTTAVPRDLATGADPSHLARSRCCRPSLRLWR